MKESAGRCARHGFRQPRRAPLRDDNTIGSGGQRRANNCSEVLGIFDAIEQNNCAMLAGLGDQVFEAYGNF
jgi:hypothetical protein